MTFARGATLTTSTTLGHSDTSNLGPTAGNGFYKRWPDDLAVLQEIGVTDVRLTLDWARLQPKPGDLNGDWAERFDNMLHAAEAIDLRVWATLHDGAEPRWVTNEGGLGDDDTISKWWPRWVERVADRFGDHVHGWVPFAGIDADMPMQPWKDTWVILDTGSAPVVASFAPEDLARIPEYLGVADRFGLVLHAKFSESADDSAGPGMSDDELDHELARLAEDMQAAIHQAAELAAGAPLIISQFTPHHDDVDVAARLVEGFVTVVDAAIDDGIDIGTAFLDPAIAGPDSPIGLLDSDRAAQPAADVYLAHS